MNYSFLIKPLIFIVSLLVGTFFILKIEKFKPSDMGKYQEVFKKEIIIEKRETYPLQTKKTLSKQDIQYAKTAWVYFENNYNKETGLVNGSDNSNYFSLEDLTSYLMGLVSAYEIKIIDRKIFDERIIAAINGIKNLPLVDGKLPSTKYHSKTLQMIDETNKVSNSGNGWSAMQIGRFMSFANKINHSYPEYSTQLKNAISGWNLNDVITEGNLYSFTNGKKIPEGKLGYEEYCAKGFCMAGYDATEAGDYNDFIKFVKLYDAEVGVDVRETEDKPANNYTLSDPYILDGIEYGWDVNSRELAYRLFSAQKQRYQNTGIVTAVGEDYVDRAPSKVYNCVYVGYKEWACIDSKGKQVDDLKTISTKAAFGWNVLFKDYYGIVLLNFVRDLNDPLKGWYAGRYENNGKPNKIINSVTNGTILETLNYKMNGKLIKF